MKAGKCINSLQIGSNRPVLASECVKSPFLPVAPRKSLISALFFDLLR